MKNLKSIFNYFLYIILYFVCIIVFAFVINKFFNNSLWGKLEQPYIQIFRIKITFTHFIHIILGLPLYIYGLNLVSRTITQNHMVRDRQTRKPIKLLTKGVYAKQRHPMYTGFICVQVGLWFSIYSPIGYLISGLVTLLISINAIYEEKKELEKLFSVEYAKYKIEVPERIFTKNLLFYLFVLMFVAVISVVTMG